MGDTMIKDYKGQMSLEYLLIFFVTIIILSSVILPLLTSSTETVDDITDAVKAKNTLVELASTVNMVYSSDSGTVKLTSIHIPSNMRIEYKYTNNTHYLYTRITLKDNTKKDLYVQVPCKITFNDNPSYYYNYVYDRWYYNVEVKWITSNSGEKSINIKFK